MNSLLSNVGGRRFVLALISGAGSFLLCWAGKIDGNAYTLATIGIVLYIAAMWIAGVMQGLMWRAINADGTLTYTFVESVKATYPFYVIRVMGGLLYLSGMIIMLWNVVKTAMGGQTVTVAIPAPAHA